MSTAQVIDRLRRSLYRVAGHPRCSCSPAQDIRAGGRQSDSDYQYHAVEHRPRAAAEMGAAGRQAHGDGARASPTSPATASPAGCSSTLVIDRKTAARLGVRVQDIDNALNNAFAQRQISIDLHPAQPVPGGARDRSAIPGAIRPTSTASTSPAPTARRCRCRPWCATSAAWRRWWSIHSQSFPSTTVSFNLLPDVPLEVATSNIQRAVDELHMPEGIRGELRRRCRRFQQDQRAAAAADPRRAGRGLHRARRALREPRASAHDHLDAAVGRARRAAGAAGRPTRELTVIAFIGIILLIGIVKKNGIMMVDFALDAERQRGLSLGGRDLRGLQRPLPADPDDDDGGAAWRGFRW